VKTSVYYSAPFAACAWGTRLVPLCICSEWFCFRVGMNY
jgi:hypothetical protein